MRAEYAWYTTDLDDDVAAVVGIARQQQHLELFVEAGDGRFGVIHLGPEHVAVVARGVGVHLASGGEVVVGLTQRTGPHHDGLELLVSARHLAVAALIGNDRGVGQAGLDVEEFLFE
jgi:hypothetical protein